MPEGGNQPKGLTAEEQARMDAAQRAWDEATELDMRRLKRLPWQDKLKVMLVLADGEVTTLGEAVTMAEGVGVRQFELTMRERHGDEQR